MEQKILRFQKYILRVSIFEDSKNQVLNNIINKIGCIILIGTNILEWILYSASIVYLSIITI